MRLLLALLALAAVAAPVVFAEVKVSDELTVPGSSVPGSGSVQENLQKVDESQEFNEQINSVDELEDSTTELSDDAEKSASLWRTSGRKLRKLRDQIKASPSPNPRRTARLDDLIDDLEMAASRLPKGATKQHLQKALELIRESDKPDDQIKALDALEDLIAELSEDFAEAAYWWRMLERGLRRLREQILAWPFPDVARAARLEKMLENLEKAASKLPEGAGKERMHNAIENFRELLKKRKPKVKEPEESKDLELKRKLEALRKLTELKKAQFAAQRDKSNHIDALEKAVARLEEAIAKLPEGSKQLEFLKKSLESLKKKLEELKGSA